MLPIDPIWIIVGVVIAVVAFVLWGKRGGLAASIAVIGGWIVLFMRREEHSAAVVKELTEMRGLEEQARRNRAEERQEEAEKRAERARQSAKSDLVELSRLPDGEDATDRDIEALIRASRRARRGERIES